MAITFTEGLEPRFSTIEVTDAHGVAITRRVLEIGCGLGKNSIALARLGANVTSVDISRTAIKKLNGYARQSGLPLKAFVCDALDIQRLGRFDMVTGLLILHHIEPFDEFCDSLWSHRMRRRQSWLRRTFR